MTDSQPLVCIFFRPPPSQQLFTRIHDIPWLILLPELEKLTTSLEALLITNFSPTAMKTLRKARRVMGSKMIPLRDFMLKSREFSSDYFGLVDSVFETKFLSEDVKEAYNDIAKEAVTKAQQAQQALSEFREELERVIVRVTSLMDGDENNVLLFIVESSLIISTMVTAIEECNSLLEEFREMFLSIIKHDFDHDSFESNPPSDEECQLVRDKWELLENLLRKISVDWNLLEVRIEIPHMGNRTSNVTPDMDGPTPQHARDVIALTGIPENPVNPEAPPNPPTSDVVKNSFWQKFFQCLSSHFSSKKFH